MAYLPHPGRSRIDLGIPGMQIGLPQMLPGMKQRTPIELGGAMPEAQPELGGTARQYGIAEALAAPVSVESGGWAEAIAEALAAGLRGRAARGERQRELDEETRGRKMEEGQRMAISEALANFDPSNPAAMVEGLRQGAPTEALDLATALATRNARQGGTMHLSPGGTFYTDEIDPATGQPRMYGRDPNWQPRRAPAGNAAPQLGPGDEWVN